MSAYRKESLVRLSYHLEEDDLTVAWLPARKAWIHATRLSVAATVAGVGAVYVFTLPPLAAVIMLVLLASSAAYFVLEVKVTGDPMAAFFAHWEERRRIRLEVTDDVFAIADGLYDSRLSWEVVLHFRETEQAFLVYVTPSQFHVIPKHVFPTPELITTMRQLLTDRVAAGGQSAIDASARTEWIPLAIYYGVFTLLLGGLFEALGHVVSALS